MCVYIYIYIQKCHCKWIFSTKTEIVGEKKLKIMYYKCCFKPRRVSSSAARRRAGGGPEAGWQ